MSSAIRILTQIVVCSLVASSAQSAAPSARAISRRTALGAAVATALGAVLPRSSSSPLRAESRAGVVPWHERADVARWEAFLSDRLQHRLPSAIDGIRPIVEPNTQVLFLGEDHTPDKSAFYARLVPQLKASFPNLRQLLVEGLRSDVDQRALDAFAAGQWTYGDLSRAFPRVCRFERSTLFEAARQAGLAFWAVDRDRRGLERTPAEALDNDRHLATQIARRAMPETLSLMLIGSDHLSANWLGRSQPRVPELLTDQRIPLRKVLVQAHESAFEARGPFNQPRTERFDRDASFRFPEGQYRGEWAFLVPQGEPGQVPFEYVMPLYIANGAAMNEPNVPIFWNRFDAYIHAPQIGTPRFSPGAGF